MKRKGCKTKYGLKIIATVMIFCAVLGGGGYVYAKYFSAAAQWGVAIASGVYLSANYAIENEDFFERVVKTDYAGGNYDNAKNDCNNQGAQLATASDYSTLISCGVTQSNFGSFTFFARDVDPTTCVYLESSGTYIAHGGCDYKPAQKYHLCSRSNI